jgi:hypothetical protein
LLEPLIVLIAAPLQVFVPALLTQATLLLLLPPLFGALLVLALPISVSLAVVSTPLLLLLSSLFLRLLLLLFLSLDPSLTAVRAILRARKTGNSKRGRNRDGKSDRQPSNVTGFHDYLRKTGLRGKWFRPREQQSLFQRVGLMKAENRVRGGRDSGTISSGW